VISEDGFSNLAARVAAMKSFLTDLGESLTVGSLPWNLAMMDLRLLAINHTVRRQRDAMSAALALINADLGHVAVGFVRPALDERLWLEYLAPLSRPESQELLARLGRYDVFRSISAQRAYIGDDVMASLWYSSEFLTDLDARTTMAKTRLKELSRKHGWSGLLPPTSWIAAQVGETALYEYLHSATSRSLHFSVGEVLRSAWGSRRRNIDRQTRVPCLSGRVRTRQPVAPVHRDRRRIRPIS